MSTGDLSRRSLLRVSGAVAAGAATGMLPGVAFAAPAPGSVHQTKTVTGTFQPDVPDWYYLPSTCVEVRRPSGGPSTTSPNAVVAMFNPISLGAA